MPVTTAEPTETSRPAFPGGVALARAKINLALHVTGRRQDGYHLLDSLIVFADVGDQVSAEPIAADGIELSVEGPFAGELADSSVSDNLVCRAARALVGEAGATRRGVGLRLDKRLPVASGLGGGSADAAATLRLLDGTFGPRVRAQKLAEIGLALGADVPACLLSRPLIARGIGEMLMPVAGMPALHLVLINPRIAIGTRDVFRGFEVRDGSGPLPSLPPRFGGPGDVAAWLRTTANDLTLKAMALTPVIRATTAILAAEAGCLLARMSGSGATIFGIFADRAAADVTAARLAAIHPDWWIVATSTGAS